MTKKLEVNIPTEFWNEIDSFTSREGMTINEFIFWALGEKIGEIRMGRGIKNLQQNQPKPDQNNNLKPYSPNQLLRASEIAKYLDISKPEAYRLIQTGELPAIRIGRLVRVKFSVVENFIETNQK
ncbi:MAG: excisionase family DNA-binding protein [Anaerolineaceae bacterium]